MVLSARAAAIAGRSCGASLSTDCAVDGKAIAYRAAVGTVAIAMIMRVFVLRKVPDRSQSDAGGLAAGTTSS